MTKRWLLTVLLALSVLLVLVLSACTGPADTTAPTTTEGAPTDSTVDSTVDSTAKDTEGSTPATSENTPETTTPPEGKTEVKENYTAVLRDFEWTGGEADTESFDFFGSGATLSNSVNLKYNAYVKKFYIVAEDGTKTETTSLKLRQQATAGVKVTVDEEAKTCIVDIYPASVKVESSWASVTAKAGSYLMFSFTTNMPSQFCVTVTASEGGSEKSAAYKQDGITVKGENGTYTGIAKCTVPYASGKTFYINICLDNSSALYPVMASIPVSITEPKYESPYKLVFQGDWELIKHKDYLDNLVELFYNVYPRLYARFGTGSEPKEITFMADKGYDGIAYCSGTLVCVAVDYANGNPSDIGFFAHEITHSVQQYAGKMYYGDGAWWTEFMADLGRFRYFHWGYSTKFPKFYSMDDPAIRDFGWQPYGQHNIFAAYLDSRYPTTKDADGNLKLGLVDAINKMIKESKVELSDNPYTVGSPFNNKVKEVTGFETMEALRLHFVKELDEGTWVFTGYRDYLDNFTTEDIPGIPNPEYPMNEPVKKGDITNTPLETPVTEGTNLALGATIVSSSSKGTATNSIEKLLDGDLATKWQGAAVRNDYKYQLAGYQHEVIIDLGASKTFDTYTIVNASIKENASFNTKEWEVFVSNDGENWISVDYQKDMNAATLSFNIGEQTARYVMLRIHKASQNNTGTVKLYEFMLFDQQ